MFAYLLSVSILLLFHLGYSTASHFIKTDETKKLYIQQDFEYYEKGTSNTSEIPRFHLPSSLVSSSPGPLPLHRFPANKASVTEISFAYLGSSFADHVYINSKQGIKKLAGHINKYANWNKTEHHSLLACKSCQFQTSVISSFNTHFCPNRPAVSSIYLLKTCLVQFARFVNYGKARIILGNIYLANVILRFWKTILLESNLQYSITN